MKFLIEVIMDEDDKRLVLLKTKQLWEGAFSKGETIFITGATGFLGKCLLESFVYINETLQLGSKIIVLSRDITTFLSQYPQFNNTSIEFLEGKLTTFEYIQQPIDYIIHAANEDNEEGDVDSRPIIIGTKRLLDFAREKKVKALLYTSSGAVYGVKPIWQHIKEDQYDNNDSLQQLGNYAVNKKRIENLCNDFYVNHGVPSKIARCFAFVGAYLPLNSHYAIGNFIKNYLDETSIVIKGDGQVHRSYLYTADLCIWLWTILFKGEPNRPYNVGSDKYFTLQEIAEKIARLKEPTISIDILNENISSKESWYIPSIQRAKDELSLDIYTPIDLAIKKTILFNNPSII
jgi:nucleoside-diphosphate-sugar epimerase